MGSIEAMYNEIAYDCRLETTLKTHIGIWMSSQQYASGFQALVYSTTVFEYGANHVAGSFSDLFLIWHVVSKVRGVKALINPGLTLYVKYNLIHLC